MNFPTIPPLFIGFAESAFIIFILVMVFGADKIPEIAKGLGKGIRGIKSATNEIKGEVMKNVYDTGKDAGEVTNELKEHIIQTKEELEKVGGPIKRRH